MDATGPKRVQSHADNPRYVADPARCIADPAS